MKWILRGLGVLGLALVVYLGVAHLSGGAFPTPGLPLGGPLGELRRTSMAFLEDLQFKDFEKAASYHAPEKRATVDIPFLIQRLFVLKPEALDIMEYEVVLAELDSSGLRARVKMRVKAKNLATEEIMTRELMLYYHRASPAAPWTMELEDSLRKLEAESGKKH